MVTEVGIKKVLSFGGKKKKWNIACRYQRGQNNKARLCASSHWWFLPELQKHNHLFFTHPQVGSLPPALPLLSHHSFPPKRCHALSSNHYACFVIIILLLPFENSLYFLRSCFPKAQKKESNDFIYFPAL